MLFAGLGMAVASAYSFEVQMNDVQNKKPAVAGFYFTGHNTGYILNVFKF
jgi:hypothetical protein